MSTDHKKNINDRMMKIMEADHNMYHFYYSVPDNRTTPLSGKGFSEQEGDILESLYEGGLVNDESVQLFCLFRDKIKEGIENGTDSDHAEMEISVKLPGETEFCICHLIAYFLRDNCDRITDIHYVIRPFSPTEKYNRDAMRSFSADKNPRLFSERNARVILSNPDKEIAFIQFDIERFRVINNTYGAERGDELLQFINDSLGVICTDRQSFGRLTADVFMIVTPFKTQQELIKFIRKLEKKLSGYKGMDYRFAFGVSIVDERNKFTRRFGDNAAAARQAVKGSAVENLCIFNESMKTEIEKRQFIEDDMNRALAQGDFVMYLQPKHSIKTGRIIGAEALARWIHPQKGMISPADFVPIFEQNGFILNLDKYIWECACKKLREWIDSGTEPVPVSVNISREYIHTADVTGILTGLIQKYDIPIRLLELEITESVESTGVEDIVRNMKAAGFKMLMDDFGSGYSSLNMLKSTPFDVLKIDKSFLDEFMESDRGQKIIRHTISMSRDIGLDIIAEGVETPQQANFLSSCGCDSAQGFYYSRPIPADDFIVRLMEVNAGGR